VDSLGIDENLKKTNKWHIKIKEKSIRGNRLHFLYSSGTASGFLRLRFLQLYTFCAYKIFS